MASDELRNAIDSFDYRQYLKYKGLSDEEIPETLDDGQKQALFRRAHEDAYADMVKAYKADPFMDNEAAQDKARQDLLEGREYLRPLFGLWEEQRTAEELYRPETVIGEALRQNGIDINDPNFNLESIPESIRYKELTPYIEQYANSIVNDNLKYNAPELAGIKKQTFIDNFKNINGIGGLDTINDLIVNTARRNAEQARQERIANGEESSWSWLGDALGVGSAGGAGMVGNSKLIAGAQGNRLLDWIAESPIKTALGSAGVTAALSLIPGLGQILGPIAGSVVNREAQQKVDYLNPENNSWLRRNLMELETEGMRLSNEATRVRNSLNYVPKYDRFLEDYAKDWDFGGFMGRIVEQGASNWPSVVQNIAVPLLGGIIGTAVGGPVGTAVGLGLTTTGSFALGAPLSAGDAVADLTDHGVYDTFEQNRYLPYVSAAVTLDYLSTLALHSGFSGLVGRGVNAGIGAVFTSRAEREAAKQALKRAAQAQGMNWNTIQSVAGRQLLKLRAAELAGASTKAGKFFSKASGPVASFLEEMYTEQAQEDIAMQLLNYGTSSAFTREGGWESLGGKFLEGGLNPRNWSPVPAWGRESMFAQYEDGARYNPRMYNERLLSAGLVGGLMGGGTHIFLNTEQAIVNKLTGRGHQQDADVIATDANGNTVLMRKRQKQRDLARRMFATMQLHNQGVNAQTVVGVDLQDVGGAFVANFNGVTGTGRDASEAFMDLSVRANANLQKIDTSTIAEVNGGWEATLANNEKLRVVGTNAEQVLRDLVTQHNSYNHPMVIRRGATIEYTPGNAKPWKITRANGTTVRAETLYDNYALYDFSTNASGNFITDTVIRRKGKQDLERKIDLNFTQTGALTFTDQLQNIQSSIANSNGKLILLDATVSKKGTKSPRIKVNGSVTNDTMRILDTESGIIYTLKLKKGRRNSNAHVNVSATSLDGRRIRLDPSVAKQALRDASNSSALTNEIRLSTPSTGITIQGETVAGQPGWHFKADQIAEITRLTGAQLMSDPQTTNHLEFAIPSWVDGREGMEMLVLDIDQNGKVFATANGETIEIEGINDRYTGESANETAGRILAETEDTLQVQALTGGTFEMVGNPDASTGAVTLRRQTAAGSTVEVTIDRRGNLTNFRLVDDPSIDLQTRIDEGITRRNQRTQAQQTQQAQLGQISDPDLATFTEEDLVQLGLNPATVNAELRTNLNDNISRALRNSSNFNEIEVNLEKMGFPPGRFLYQDVLGGGQWVLRDRDGKVIGNYTNDKNGLRDLQHMSHARIEAAFGTDNIVPYVLEQFVDGIRNRGYTTDVTNVTNEDYTRALGKYLSYYDAVFGPEQESYVSSADRDTLVRQRLQQRWQDIYDGRVVLSTIQDALKFYGDYIQRGYRLYDWMNDTLVDSNFARVEPTDASAFINERDINSVPRREGVGIIEAYMIGDRVYGRLEILKAAHQKNNLDTIQYDQMENLAQQELQKYTETPSVRARRGERRYIDRLNRLIREETAPLLLMNNLDDVIAYYEGKGGSVGIYHMYTDPIDGMYVGKDGQRYSKIDINTSDIVRQLVQWEGTSKPNFAVVDAEEIYTLQRLDGVQIVVLQESGFARDTATAFMETLKRADTMMAFLDTIETNDRVNDALAQETQEVEATALTRQEAEDQIIAELFEQAQVASTGADFLELYRGQLQKRYVVRDLDSGLYKSRNVDSADLSADNFLDENEVRDMTMPTNYDIVGYWVLYNADAQTVANFDTDANFDTFSDRLRNQDMLDVIDREELVTRRVEESEVSVGQQNARRETLRQQREAVAAQAQAAAQAAQQPPVNPASAPDSIPYAETLVRMFGNEALVSLSNKIMLFGDAANAWSIRDANYQLRKVRGEHGVRNINDPNQSLDREMRRSFARKLWRSAVRRNLVRVHKTLNDFYAVNPQAAEQLYLEYGRGMVAASRQESIRSVARDDTDVINYVNALTDEQKLKIRTDYGPQGYYSRDNGTIDLVEETIPNEMGVTVFFHELAVHATSHLTKDLNVAWERIANFLRTQAKGTVNADGKKTINKIGLAVHDIIQNRGINFGDNEWGFWEEVAAYFVADHINNLSFAQNVKALFRRWFRQTGIVAQGEDITVEDILHFARHAAKVGIARGENWKTSNEGKDMHDAFSAIGSIYHRPENVVRDQMSLLQQHYQEDRNMDMMGMVYDRATGLAQHSNLNRARWLLVRTPFYKYWFGDWENDPQRASKVVDGNGEPLLVPHARKHDAIAYDLPFTGFNGNFGYSGQYTYGTISDNPYLDRFSGSPIAQVFLNVRKPLQAHNYSHMSQTMRRLGFQESTVRLDLRSMLNDMMEDTEAYAVMEGIARYSEDENPKGSFSDFLILNDDLLATVFPNATMREAHRFVTGLFEAATTPSGSILVEEPVTGASTTEEYAESLGEEERRHLAEAADIFDRHLEGFENQMVRLSYNPDGYFTAFSRAHDDVSMSTRETITDVLGAIDQRAQEYKEADMLTFKEAVARAYEEISALQESEISNDEAFLNILNLALHKLRREELAVRLGIEPITIPAYPTMPTRMMLKENNLQLAERLRGEMLRQGFDGLWGTDDILLLHPDQAHEALEFVQPYGNVSTGTQGVTMTPYERSIMDAVEDNLARDAERLDVPLVRLRSEYRSIYQAFAPSAPWIKSNLDEYNWVLVRTPSFKENFGDWQNDATEDMWLDWRDEPVRTSEGFLNGETIVRTEEGYFSSISAPAFGRLAGTREYSQAIDQAALENLFGVTDLTEERIALEQQIRDLQTQDAELVTRIQAIQAQIAAVQAQVPSVQDRQPQQVFADPQLIAERDALLARAEELRLQIAGIREGMTESVTPGEAVSATDRLREVETLIAGLQRSLDREFDSPLFTERYVDVTRRRHERLRTELENLRTQLGSMSSEEIASLNVLRGTVDELNAQIEEQRSREENFANTLNELLRQRNDAIVRRDGISEQVSSLNDQLIRKARERLLQEKESLEYKLKQMRKSDSTSTRAWMREENVRLRLSEIDNFLEMIGDPEGSTIRNAPGRIAELEARIRALGFELEAAQEEDIRRAREAWERKAGRTAEETRELNDLLNEREALRRTVGNYEAGNIVRGLATVRERLLEQASEVNRQIFDKFKRESRKQSTEARNRIRRTRQIMRRQTELQTRNTDTLRELANVTGVLNTIRESIRNRPGRAADEARAAQLMLGAERLENEKWEFIDEMAEMMWEVSQRLGNVNAVIRDNPGASQTALNAMNARKAELVAELDNLRYQILNGSYKLDEDIVLARQEAHDLLQLVNPLTEQTITHLESRQDEIIARQQEIEAELDTLDERLMNLTGTASEAVRTMKDSLLEQLDQLNAQRGALAVHQTELSRQRTLTQRAIDQRSNTLDALNRVDAYALAGQLEAMGYSAEHIKLVTGFERDKEGNWTYHLSNRDASFRNPIFIIEERLRELYKRAGLRMKPSNAARFRELKTIFDEYYQLYRNESQELSDAEQARMSELRGEIYSKLANFADWITGAEKTRIADALKKRGMSDNVDAVLYAPIRLSDMFSDSALFTAYPELRNTVVDLVMEKDNLAAGGKYPGQNRMRFNLGHMKLQSVFVGSVLHEIQHQIQEWETWTGGAQGDTSTPETMRDYLRNYGEFTARYASRTWNMTQEQLRAYNQDKFLDEDNNFWNEWFKDKYNVPMRSIGSDEFIFNSGGTSDIISSIMPHGQQRQADVVYPDFTERQVDGYFSLSKKNREEAIREMRDPRRGRPDLSEEQMGLILDELDRYDQPKKQKLMLKWMLNGSLAMPIVGRSHHEAYQVDEAMELAAKMKVDPFGFESPVDILNRYKKLNPDRIPIAPESVPELDMDSRIDHGDGIVSYQVQDDEAGQKAVRRIINSHWGKNWSNWCLTRANAQGQLEQPEAWDMWHKYYNALPKRVAFKNGKIISLMATDDTGGYRIATTIRDLTDYIIDDLVSEMAGDPRPLEGYGLTKEEAYMFTDYVLFQDQVREIREFDDILRKGVSYDNSIYLNRAIDFIKNRLLVNDEFELDILNNPSFSDGVKEVLSNPDTLRDELGKVEMMDEWLNFSFRLTEIVQRRRDEQRDKLLGIEFYKPRQVENGALEIVDRNGNSVDLVDLGLYGVENRFYWDEKERAYVTRTSEKWWDQNNKEHSNLDWARGVTEGYRRRRSTIDPNTTLGYFSMLGPQGAARFLGTDDYRQTAEAMRQAGKDARTIKLATGYEWSDDQQAWEYEVSNIKHGIKRKAWKDVLATFREGIRERIASGDDLHPNVGRFLEELNNHELGKPVDKYTDRLVLSDVFNAPEIYEAYPSAVNIDVQISFHLPDNTNAEYDALSETIRLNPFGLFDLLELRSSILHEVQHHIQNEENFLYIGANGNEVDINEYQNNPGEVEARRVENRRYMTQDEMRNSLFSETYADRTRRNFRSITNPQGINENNPSYFSAVGNVFGRTSNYNLDIYDREEIQGSGGAYRLSDGRIFIDPNEVGEENVARVMLYALIRENQAIMGNENIARAVAIIREWENSANDEWRNLYNRIRNNMNAVHAPDSALLAYAVREFMANGTSAINPTNENGPEGAFAAILREIPAIMGQAAGVSTNQVTAMPSDVITVTNALSEINNDTIDVAVPSLNMDQRTFEALETKATAPAFMDAVMQDVKRVIDEYDNMEFQFINGVPHVRMGDLVLNLGTDPIFARNIVDQIIQNTVDMGNHDLTDRQNPGEEQDESMKLFGDLAKRLPQDAQLLGNARQADVEKFIEDNIPAYIANRIRVFYEETEESKAIFGEEYNGRFRPLMADREVIFIKAYGNRSLADVVGTTVKMVSMFGWNIWNNADFIPLMNELYTALEHNIRTELPSYYNKIRGRKPNSAEKSALISAYLASKSTSIYELGDFARSVNVPTTREQELIDLAKRLRTEIDKVSLHMAESFASDFSQNEELVKEYTEKLLRLTMAPFHGQGLWLAYDLDYDRVRQTNPDTALALQKWENLSRVTVFANDFGPTYTAEPVTDEAISNAMMVRKFRNASPFMQKVWRLYWRNWHPPQKHIGDTILGTENTVMLGRAFRAVTEDLGISMRNVFQNVAQFKEELLNLGIDTEEFDGRKGYEQELRDRGITNEKVIAKAVITDSFLRFGRQRMLENVIEIRRLITANTQKLEFWMRRENVPERQIQRMHAEMNAFANKFISDWEHRSYRAYTERGQDDLTEMYRIIDGSKGRTNFASTMPKIRDEINNLEKKKNAGQIGKRAYARERKKLRHKLKIYERLDALYNWANQTVMARLPARPSQAQAANVPKDTIEAMKKEIERVRTLVATEKERGIGGRMEMIPGVRKRKLDERNPHDRLYMTFLDQVRDPATAMLYSLDQQGKIMDKLIFNTRFGEAILQNGMGSMRGSQTSTGLKVNNLSWMENGTFLRYVQIDSFFLDEIANEMKIQDALRDSIMGHLINLIKQNFTVLNWRMSISNWIGNLSNLIATGQIFRFRNWGMAFDMNKDKFFKNFIVDYEKTVKDLSKKDCMDAINAAAREYNANIAQYQAEMNKLNIWGSGLTSAQIDAYGQGGWEKVSDFLGTALQSISEKTNTGFFDDVSKEKMARMTGTMMRYAREFYGFGDEWVKPLTYINNRAVALAKHRAINNWSRFEGRETDQAAIELDRRIREEAVREAALLTLKETTTWELSPDFARKITRNAARIVAPDFLLHQFQMVRIMAVNTQRIFECADEVGRLNAKGKRNWTPDEKVYYKLVQGEMIRRGIGSSMMTAAFALMYTSAFSLTGYLANLMAGSLAGSGDSLEKRKRKTRDPNGAVGMDARDFEGTTKLCNVVSMISDLYAPVIWVPGKVGKEFYAYNDQRVNAAYTMAMVRPPSVNPSTMERLKNLALTLVNMETVPLTVQLVNLWHGKNSFGQNITVTESIWETLSLLTPQIFHQGYHVVQGADRAMLGTEDLGWREKNRHRELSVFDIGGVKVRRISVDDIIENTGRKVKQLTSNENANRRVFLDTLQRNPDMSDRDIKIAVDRILASNKLEMDKIAYAMSAFRDIGVDRDRLLKRLTKGRNTTSPILGENRANQLIEGRDVLSLILLTNLSERIKSIEGNLDPDTDFSKDERRKVTRNLRTAMRMIQEAEK